MSRSTHFTVYPYDEGVVMRWKHAGKRVVLKMKGVTEAQAAQTAIPLLMEALASLRADEAKSVMTIA